MKLTLHIVGWQITIIIIQGRLPGSELPDRLARVAGIEGVKIACQEGEGKYAKSE